ncbi:MAG: HAMP domain-containing protein [Phycisphaeraceae bacterium]|nr:HAMP domain-containing protein [Phycisphaeraceae bacterium]
MSLLSRFAILFGMIGVAVVGSLYAAWWVIDVRDQTTIRPAAASAGVLRGLGAMKEHVEAINAGAGGRSRLARTRGDSGAPPSGSGEPDRATLTADTEALVARLADLESNEWYVSRVGRSTALNIAARVEECRTGVDALLRDAGPADRAGVFAATADLHDLIELAERHILNDTGQIVAFDASLLRSRLLWILRLSFLWVALMGALAFLFVRRWILRPVSRLRTAASRIGGGDFDHRLPVDGSDELALLSAEVNHMASMVRTLLNEQIERERLAAIGEMVRRLAHNLRNPLAGIRGLAELTRSELPRDAASAGLRENQHRIIAAVDRFEGWLKELLGATAPLKIQRESSDIVPLLEGLTHVHQPIAQTKGITLVLKCDTAPRLAVFDARHLEQAVSAVIANAIDVSPPGGTVTISASIPPGPAPREWWIQVSDQGPGVPPELITRIFNPYFTTKRDGNGIGLAVCQQVVRAHGGRVTVEDAAVTGNHGFGGPGATFTIRLPYGISGAEGGNQLELNALGATGGENSRHRG